MKHQFDYSDAFFAMGTVNTISADLEYREAVRKARKEVLSLHKRFNVFEESSEISQININAGKMISVSRDTCKLLSDSCKYEKLTEGAFKITTLPASRMWRRAGSENRMPTDDELVSVRKRMPYDAVMVDSKRLLAGVRSRHGCAFRLRQISGGVPRAAGSETAGGGGCGPSQRTVFGRGTSGDCGMWRPFPCPWRGTLLSSTGLQRLCGEPSSGGACAWLGRLLAGHPSPCRTHGTHEGVAGIAGENCAGGGDCLGASCGEQAPAHQIQCRASPSGTMVASI